MGMPEIDRMMLDKIEQVAAVFNWQETLDERKNNLKQQHRKYQDEVASLVYRTKTQVEGKFLPGQNRMVLALKVSGGEVLEAYELDES
jgi:hypothetical protein